MCFRGALASIRKDTRHMENSLSGVLASTCLSVRLYISLWSGRKQDKRVTAQIHEEQAADRNSGRYWKRLVADELKKVERKRNDLRTFYYNNTYSLFSDVSDHWRLITVPRYEAFSQSVRDMIHELDTAWNAFLLVYPHEVEAERGRKGRMFNENDYPTLEQLRNKFLVDLKIRPVPYSGNLVVDLAESELKKIQAEIKQSEHDAVNHVVTETFERLLEKVDHMAVKLRDGDDGKRQIFKNTLTSNLVEVMSVARDFNITKDSRIDSCVDAINAKLLNHTADQLRESETARETTRDDAKKIAEQLRGYLA